MKIVGEEKNEIYVETFNSSSTNRRFNIADILVATETKNKGLGNQEAQYFRV